MLGLLIDSGLPVIRSLKITGGSLSNRLYKLKTQEVIDAVRDGGKISDPQTESDKRSNFGDWIIWKQVMDHATSAKSPIILVTDDRKEDWWEEENGKSRIVCKP